MIYGSFILTLQKSIMQIYSPFTQRNAGKPSDFVLTINLM